MNPSITKKASDDIIEPMEQDPLEKRDDALTFLVGHVTGVLATHSTGVAGGTPRARLVYYTCDDAFNVYFITLANTRKVEDLGKDPHAAFVVAEPEIPRTIQMEGIVTDLTESATIDPMLSDLMHTLMSNEHYGAPLARFDTSTLKFYRLSPTWVRWGDFTFGHGTDKVLSEIDPEEK